MYPEGMTLSRLGRCENSRVARDGADCRSGWSGFPGSSTWAVVYACGLSCAVDSIAVVELKNQWSSTAARIIDGKVHFGGECDAYVCTYAK